MRIVAVVSEIRKNYERVSFLKVLRAVCALSHLKYGCSILSRKMHIAYLVHLLIHELIHLAKSTVTAGRDHCLLTYCPYIRTSVPTLQIKQNKTKTLLATGENVGLAAVDH